MVNTHTRPNRTIKLKKKSTDESGLTPTYVVFAGRSTTQLHGFALSPQQIHNTYTVYMAVKIVQIPHETCTEQTKTTTKT